MAGESSERRHVRRFTVERKEGGGIVGHRDLATPTVDLERECRRRKGREPSSREKVIIVGRRRGVPSRVEQ